MVEAQSERMYHRGDFTNEVGLQKIRIMAQESGARVELIREPGQRVATVDDFITLQKGEYFVGTTFENKRQYDMFAERMRPPKLQE